MGLDIAQMRLVPGDPDQPPGKESPREEELPPRDEFIIEAVVTPDILGKLKAMGFEVSEMP